MEINEVFKRELQLKVETEKLRENTDVESLLNHIKLEYEITDEQLYQSLEIKKSTFYRRLKAKNWTVAELYRINNIKFFRDEYGTLNYRI
jgi:predicted transcriptional regulator